MAKRIASKKACCLVSELLEEAGIDRENVRLVRRQVLEGVVLFCQWQLERMSEATPKKRRGPGRGRRVPVE
jgi:hypothetical protein